VAEDLEGALRALGEQLEVPPAPEMTMAVRVRLSAAPPPRRRPVLRYALVIILLLVSGVVIAVPPVRAAVLEFFRIGGVEVIEGPGPSLPATPAMPEQPVADLGEARRLTGLPVGVPAALGPPDQILVTEGRIMSLVYRPAGDRPAARLDVFDGRLDPLFIKYLRNRPVEVGIRGGVTGWFVPGPHEVVYVDDAGQRQRESARLAASTLIWQDGGVTYRLEADLPAERLVAIARSLPAT
jgi:hypothetical protein